jgi:hypothetical protein
LIGRFDLVHHCLVHVPPGEQSGDRSQYREDRRAQCHPRNPWGTAVFRGLLYVFVQMLQRNFRFFHMVRCKFGILFNTIEDEIDNRAEAI